MSNQDHQECDCPLCSLADIEPDAARGMVAALLATGPDPEDPLQAELGMAMLLSVGALGGIEEAWRAEVLAALDAEGTPAAAALIAATAAVSDGQARDDALAALARPGAPAVPSWAAQLAMPATLERAFALVDGDGDTWALVAQFARGGERHAFAVLTEPDECCAAFDITLALPDELAEELRVIHDNAEEQGYALTEVTLDPAEFRWHAQAALDARAVHDLQDMQGMATEPDEDDDEDVYADEYEDEYADEDDEDDDLPAYQILALLLGARLRALPEPAEPAPPHGRVRRPAAGDAGVTPLRPARPGA